ncbi:MAG: hypothetical protein AAGA75_22775 [Cyanobacteria bacterium P01_E01_bin.6]
MVKAIGYLTLQVPSLFRKQDEIEPILWIDTVERVGLSHWADHLSREEFSGILGRFVPQNPALKTSFSSFITVVTGVFHA